MEEGSHMKTVFSLLLTTILLTGCFSRTTMMTRNEFDGITVGMTVQEVEDCVGTPYAVCKRADGTEEHEYIERVNIGGDRIFQNHYFLTIMDGRVVGKHASKERPPAFDLIYQDDPNNLGSY
jgi:outer membrane protein assembly factor BamE (lipoprotein component of BamABCDE complex)